MVGHTYCTRLGHEQLKPLGLRGVVGEDDSAGDMARVILGKKLVDSAPTGFSVRGFIHMDCGAALSGSSHERERASSSMVKMRLAPTT
jgi:hypothetical protein